MNLKKSVKLGFGFKGGNQEGLAKHLNKTPGTVSNYLAGRVDPPFSVVLSMCEYFNVSMVIFAGWSERDA